MAQLTMKKCWNCNSESVITATVCPFCKERLGLIGKDGIATKIASQPLTQASSETRFSSNQAKWILLGCGGLGILAFIPFVMVFRASEAKQIAEEEASAQAQRTIDRKARDDKEAVAKAEAARVEAAKTPEQRAREAKEKAAKQEAARRAAIAQAAAPVTIAFDFPDNLTTNLSMVSVSGKIFEQLKTLQAQGRIAQTPSVTFEITAEMEDTYGNKSKGSMMSLRFSGDDLRRINWPNMNNWKIMEFCHPTSHTNQARSILVEFAQQSTAQTFAPSLLGRALRS